MQVFSVYAAVLGGAPSTSHEEMVGLWAHQHLIVQLPKDMGAAQWTKYNHDFCEWAVAKGVRKWGELNLPIYGRCLSVQHWVASTTPTVGTNIGRQKRDRRGKSLNSEGVLFQVELRTHM